MHPTPRFSLPNVTTTIINLAGDDTSSCGTNAPGHFITPKIPAAVTIAPLPNDEVNGHKIKIVDLPEYLYVETKFISAPLAKKCNLLDNKKHSKPNVKLRDNFNLNNTSQNGENVRAALPISISVTTSHTVTTPTITQQQSSNIIQPVVPICNYIINQNSRTNTVPYNTATITTNTTTPPNRLNTQMPFGNVNTLQTSSHQMINCNTTLVPLPTNKNSQSEATAKTSVAQNSRPIMPLATLALTTQHAATMKKDAETMTDLSAAIIDRYQQTDNIMPKTTTIAVQCNRYEEDDNTDDVEVTENVVEVVEENPSRTMQNNQNHEFDDIDVENNFRQFLINSSYQYNNGLRECLICGEIMKWDKHFMAHMSIHWGPKVLCYKCGQLLQHKTLLKKHCCTPCYYHQTKTKSISQLFRCPYYRCGITAISPMELYDHINEHNKLRTYICQQCTIMFYTYDEFNQHKHLRMKCFIASATAGALKRSKHSLYKRYSKKCRQYRNRVYSIYMLSGRQMLVRKPLRRNASICQICLKSYRNRTALELHMNKCFKLYNKRLALKTLKYLREF